MEHENVAPTERVEVLENQVLEIVAAAKGAGIDPDGTP